MINLFYSKSTIIKDDGDIIIQKFLGGLILTQTKVNEYKFKFLGLSLFRKKKKRKKHYHIFPRNSSLSKK